MNAEQIFDRSPSHAKTMLVVEDSANDLELLRFAIGDVAGFRFRFVNDGDEAIDYLEGLGRFGDRNANPYPELVLVDLNLTKVDGFAVLEWISKANQQPRVFAWTGSHYPKYAERARALGAVQCFSKPNSIAGYRAIISTMAKTFNETAGLEEPTTTEFRTR